MSIEIRKTLMDLGVRLRREVNEGLSKGLLKQTETVAMVWKVDQSAKTEGGVVPSGASGDYALRRDWSQAIVRSLIDSQQFEEYSNALKMLKEEFSSAVTQQAIDGFVTRIAEGFLNDPKRGDDYIDDTITILTKGLRDEPLQYAVTAGLLGLQIGLETIQADSGVFLRQPTVEDFEKDVLPFGTTGFSPMLPYPTTILHIEIQARHARELQTRVEHAIAMLRLFRVGSVYAPSYRFSSESITDPFGRSGMSSGLATTPLENYIIRRDELSEVKDFWQSFATIIPPSFYELNAADVDHVTIAYRRYVDALMQNGLIERRIANAVMGLEALLLIGAEQELVYRLSNRLSKLLSMLGYDQYKVRQTIRDTYRVRSLFVHGSQLSYKDNKRLANKYKNVRELLWTVLNYLRVSIVAMILARMGKDEFIDRLDDSLIDRKREEEFARTLQTAKTLVSGKVDRI
jgi:hypothetical protein